MKEFFGNLIVWIFFGSWGHPKSYRLPVGYYRSLPRWDRDWNSMAEYEEDYEHVWVIPPEGWSVNVESYKASAEWEVITFTHETWGEHQFIVKKIQKEQN
jgi:hypothetical protein